MKTNFLKKSLYVLLGYVYPSIIFTMVYCVGFDRLTTPLFITAVIIGTIAFMSCIPRFKIRKSDVLNVFYLLIVYLFAVGTLMLVVLAFNYTFFNSSEPKTIKTVQLYENDSDVTVTHQGKGFLTSRLMFEKDGYFRYLNTPISTIHGDDSGQLVKVTKSIKQATNNFFGYGHKTVNYSSYDIYYAEHVGKQDVDDLYNKAKD